MIVKIIGENIKIARENIRISQTQLAKSIDRLSPGYISYIERGYRSISVSDLIKTAKVLKTTVGELIGEKPYKDRTNEYRIVDAFGRIVSKIKL